MAKKKTTRRRQTATTASTAPSSKKNSPLRVAMLGTGFMGRAHSNAWRSAGTFFDLPRPLVMHSACGSNLVETGKFARQWGWGSGSDDWASLVRDPEVDLVDICTPNHLHAEMSIAALEAGKHAACEKPMAGTLDDARLMRDAAKKAARKGVQPPPSVEGVIHEVHPNCCSGERSTYSPVW